MSDMAPFWAKVDVRGPDACWEWLGAKDPHGYGRTNGFATHLAHRVSYQAVIGPVPSDLELDHLCRNTGCVNPAHLEPVSHAENMARGKQATKTHCKHGHEFTPENTHRRPANGTRMCRTCNRLNVADIKRRRLAELAASA